MSIDVKKIAKLAYLKIEDDEIAGFEKKVQDMLDMVADLPDISEYDSKPKIEDAMELRKDEIQPSLNRDKLLGCAPKAVAGCIVVPKTLE